MYLAAARMNTSPSLGFVLHRAVSRPKRLFAAAALVLWSSASNDGSAVNTSASTVTFPTESVSATSPTTTNPTTAAPTTVAPTTKPTTAAPTTVAPTTKPTTAAPYDGTLGPILFLHGTETAEGRRPLFTIEVDGSNQQLVRAAWDGLAVSPDGTMLATTKAAPNGHQASPVVFDANRSDERVIPWDDPTLSFGVADWSPDGTHLVGEAWDDAQPSRNGVYTVAVAGGDLVRLTAPDPKHDFPAGSDTYSPDGTKILFFRTVDDNDGNDDQRRVNLMVVNADGTGTLQLSPPQYQAGLLGLGSTSTTSWSPDGTKVAFVVADGPGTFFSTTKRAVFIVGADGTGLTQVTDWTDVLTVQWSPDGNHFAVTMRATPNDYNIFTMRPDGGDVRQLTTFTEHDSFAVGPLWSPDGSTLMYVHGHGDPQLGSIWVTDVTTGDSRPVTAESTGDFLFAWTPT